MPRILKDDIDGRIMHIVYGMGGSDLGDEIDISALWDLTRLSRETLDSAISGLRRAETSARRLRGQLEAVRLGNGRTCPVCDKAVTGRADQKFCGATCRQRARRAAARASGMNLPSRDAPAGAPSPVLDGPSLPHPTGRDDDGWRGTSFEVLRGRRGHARGPLHDWRSPAQH